MSLEADAIRGRQAKEILDNAIYADAYASVESEIVRLWKESRDAQDREQLHTMLGLLSKVQTAMASVMRSGEVAQAELSRKLTKAEQMARYAIRG